jgi:hypothetical protein
MSENNSVQGLQPRRPIIRAIANRFIKDAFSATQNMPPVQALEITSHLLDVLDFLEQYATNEDGSIYKTFWQGEEKLIVKWGRLAKPYKEQKFQTYFDPISILTEKEIVTIEEYNSYKSGEEQCVSAEELKAVVESARHSLQIVRDNLLTEQPPAQEAMDALSKDPTAIEQKSPAATHVSKKEGLGQNAEDSEDEGAEKDSKFTKSRSRLALYFLVKAAGVEPRADSAVSALAKLAHLITGEKLSSINNSNTYKFYLGMPDYKTAKGRLADLHFVRPYFEDLSMERALIMIDEEIARAGSELPKHKGA